MDDIMRHSCHFDQLPSGADGRGGVEGIPHGVIDRTKRVVTEPQWHARWFCHLCTHAHVRLRPYVSLDVPWVKVLLHRQCAVVVVPLVNVKMEI